MLATKEFIEKVESTGYKTEIGHRRIYIYKTNYIKSQVFKA